MHKASQLFGVSAVCSSPSRCTLMESMRFTTSMLKPNWLQIKLSRHIRHVAIQHANQAHIRPTSALTHRSTKSRDRQRPRQWSRPQPTGGLPHRSQHGTPVDPDTIGICTGPHLLSLISNRMVSLSKAKMSQNCAAQFHLKKRMPDIGGIAPSA